MPDLCHAGCGLVKKHPLLFRAFLLQKVDRPVENIKFPGYLVDSQQRDFPAQVVVSPYSHSPAGPG